MRERPELDAVNEVDADAGLLDADTSAAAALQLLSEFPVEDEQALAARVGTWNIKISMWNDPSAPVQVSEGTSTMSLILGGRYLQDVTHSTYNGMPFAGHGLTGYDNLKKKFVSTWIDNMGTGLMVAEGTYDAATKTCTSLGEAPDPMAGKYMKLKTVDTTLGPDHWTSVMYSQTPDGKGWWKMMEMDYTRKK